MSDGRVVIDVKANDTDIDRLKKKLNTLGDAYEGAFQDKSGRWRAANGRFLTMSEQSEMLKGKLKGVGDSSQQAFQGIDNGSKKASFSIIKMAASLGLVKVASAAFDVLKNSMGAAISRFDTFKSFPKVMSALGFSTDDSSDAVKKLGDGIDGLPTKLDDVVSTTKRMASVTGNLDESTDATLALNNAMLASGASTADASRGMDQYIQMLSTGKVDMTSWRTLQETMPIGLQKTAEAMGYVGESAQNDLYAALKSGDVTFKDFQKQLIELGTGTGELAELAKINSEGIATSFSNLANTASKGLASLLEALDDALVEATGKNIAKHIDSLKNVINLAFKAMGKAIQSLVPVLKLVVGAFKLVLSTASALSPVLIGLATAFIALKVVDAVNGFLTKHKTLLALAGGSSKQLTVATLAQAAATKATATATEAENLALLAKNGTVKLSTLLIGVLTGTTTASAAASAIATAAIKVFSAAVKVALGPIGLAIIAITAVVTAVTAVVKWFKKASDETAGYRKETENLVSSSDALNSSVKENNKSRDAELKSIESNSAAYGRLADDLESLVNTENQSAADKKALKDTVDQLNGSVDNLGLAYDEESNKLSVSTEMIKARIEAQKEQETANIAQENLLQIMKEQNDVEMELKYASELRDNWNKKVEEGTGNFLEDMKVKRDAKLATEELDAQEKLLLETKDELIFKEGEYRQVITDANEAVATAVEAGVNKQMISYAAMSEEQKAAVDSMTGKWQEYSDAATNMFDTLSDAQTVSVAEMTANMAENQRVIGEWADNIAILAKRGVDEGLLDTLRESGPSSAGHVKAMVNASDAELDQMSTVFGEGAKTATTALSTGFDIGKTDVEKSVMGIVSASKTSLSSEIKAADFNSLGKEVPNGVTAGVKAGSKEAEGATKDMGSKMSKGFATEMGIHSPSRVFKQFGSFITQGLTQGITQGNPMVQMAMSRMQLTIVNGMTRILINVKQLSSRIPRQFDGMSGEMSGIGRNIMYGLSAGIWAGSGAAIAAANSVASRIKSTIKSAMDIHSPSRWMRDFIGKNMMAGWGIGLDKYADLPDKSMREAIDRVKGTVTTAEFALNTGNRGIGSGSIANYNNTVNNSGLSGSFVVEVPVNLDGRETARVIAPFSQKEIERLEGRERRRKGVL